MFIGYSPTAIIVYTFWSPHTLGMLKETVNNRIKYSTKDRSWCIFVQSCDDDTAEVHAGLLFIGCGSATGRTRVFTEMAREHHRDNFASLVPSPFPPIGYA